MSDDFRPKFPLDPFAAVPHREPWLMNAGRLLTHPGRDVLLVLGAPSAKDLEPFLYSPRFTSSLLIIATHEPPSIPPIAQPAIRVLRLPSPLALEDSGSVRFVSLLEWAERVARVWRKRGGGGILELTEESDVGDVGASGPRRRVLSTLSWSSPPPSPQTSTSNLSVSSARHNRHSLSLSNKISERPRFSSGLPSVDPSQRAFDGLINFLPAHLPDKALLKHLILVTTISRPFLIASMSVSAVLAEKAARPRRQSLLRPNSFHFQSLPSTPDSIHESFSPQLGFPSSTPKTAHLVHLLTHQQHVSSHSKLVQSMESFLLSFCYRPSHNAQPPEQTTHPFVMGAATVCECVPNPTTSEQNTIAEAVLSGALDQEGTNGTEWVVPPRAWVCGPADIVVAENGSARSSRAETLRILTMTRGNGSGRPHYDSISQRAMSTPRLSFSGSGSGYSSAESTPPSTPPAQSAVLPMPYVGKAIHLVPTPPDSEESTSEVGVGDGDAVVKKKGKKSGWRFWRTSAPPRSRSISISVLGA